MEIGSSELKCNARFKRPTGERYLFMAHARIILVFLCSVPFVRADGPSFRNEVMAVLAKAGCNQGTCHGNAKGKGGFQLSLRGEDLWGDYAVLTKDQLGRRTNLLEPEKSLLLRKATQQIAHKGGKRFATGSAEYNVLRDWIAAGMPEDIGEAPAMVGLEVSPVRQVIRAPESTVQIRAKATFSDGSVQDVTSRAVYFPSNENAKVTAVGKVERLEFGEVTVLVRFLQRQVPVTLAFIPDRNDFEWSKPPEVNFVDRHVFRKLKDLRLNPSGLCSDNAFIRRAYLDLLGFIPPPEAVEAFVKVNTAEKRMRLVDQLLARPEFADFWALKWGDLLRSEEKQLDRKGVHVFHEWIRRSLIENRPLNEFAADIVRARGSTYRNPPANFYRANRSPVIRAENAAQVFLGVRLKCAQCHNHPFDRWTQGDYYDWTAMFAGVNYKMIQEERVDRLDKNEFIGEQIVTAKTDTVTNPRSGKSARHRLLGGETVPAQADQLDALAEWLASGDNPFFARVQVNRVWYHLMGRGLVNPVDDLRPTNPASHPELLEDLADDFAGSGFDLRQLIRRIMASRTYQLTHLPNSGNVDDEANYARTIPRRIEAEQLLDSIAMSVGAWPKYSNHPQGTRAGQIAGGLAPGRRRGDKPTSADVLLGTFGKPERLIACDCERSKANTLRQSFVMWSSPVMNDLITETSNHVAVLMKSDRPVEGRIRESFMRIISREPKPVEMKQVKEFLTGKDEDREAWEDVVWSLLNTKEFLFRW